MFWGLIAGLSIVWAFRAVRYIVTVSAHYTSYTTVTTKLPGGLGARSPPNERGVINFNYLTPVPALSLGLTSRNQLPQAKPRR